MKDEILGLPEEENAHWQHFMTPQGNGRSRSFWRIFIDVASIPGVGPARKAALRSFGIETAADVTRRG